MRQRQPSARAAPAAPEPGDPLARGARDRLTDRPEVRAACGHTRYTKGCDLCALTGIYRDHLSRPGITPAERSMVIRLYLAGDKAGLFKLWQALAAENA